MATSNRNTIYTTRGSTSSINRLIPQTNLQNDLWQRNGVKDQERKMTIMGSKDNMDDTVMKSGIPRVRKDKTIQNSGQRKRSRMYEEDGNVYVKEGATSSESGQYKVKLDDLLQVLHNQIEAVFAKGERGKIMVNKNSIQETLGQIGLDIFKLVVLYCNAQDEKSALQYQVIQLMQSNTMSFPSLGSTGSPPTTTYLQAAMMKKVADNIYMGTRLPIPEVPSGIRHAPAEKVLIFKAENKGVQLSKDEKEQFRMDVNKVIGEELMDEVDVIRPTRNGGHTIIFQSEQSRCKALEVFRKNEKNVNIEEEKSCIVAPKKKFVKVVCRDPPNDLSMDSVLNDFYGKGNVHLHQILRMHRETRIIDTRFGWIFEMSSIEAVAVQAQGGRIQFGHAREMKVEEYIALQQCYRCCIFGHNAKDCLSENEYCRLCGEMGYTGWDCLDKDDRNKWRCALPY